MISLVGELAGNFMHHLTILYFNSVRVSNELGAGRSQAAKFAVEVVSVTSTFIGVLAMILVLTTRDFFPYLFTSSNAVAKETTKISILLAFTVLLNSLQPVLSGKNNQFLPKMSEINSCILQFYTSRQPLNLLSLHISGVAIGAGWQHIVAYINIGCYYVIGLPAGILLGFTLDLGVMVSNYFSDTTLYNNIKFSLKIIII